MPLFGPPDVAKLSIKRDISGLINALTYQDKNPAQEASVRFDAVEALGLLRAPAAVEPLLAVLSERTLELRAAAVEALGRLRDPRAVGPITDLLLAHLDYPEEPHRWICQEAIRALGKLGEQSSAKTLLRVLRSRDGELRHLAAEALEKIRWQPGKNQDGAYFWAVKGEYVRCVEIGVPAIEPLASLLNDVDAGIRRRALEALAEIHDPKVLPILMRCLRDWKYVNREVVFQALAGTRNPAAIDAIADYVSSPETRQAAGKALASMGQLAVSHLLDLIDGPDVARQSRAAAALVAMGTTGVESVLRYLDGRAAYSTPEARRAVVQALVDANKAGTLDAACEDLVRDWTRRTMSGESGNSGHARGREDLLRSGYSDAGDERRATRPASSGLAGEGPADQAESKDGLAPWPTRQERGSSRF